MLTGYSEQTELHKLIAAPHMLRERMMSLIRRETEAARKRPACGHIYEDEFAAGRAYNI